MPKQSIPFSSLKWLLKKEFLSFKRNKEIFYGYLLYVIGIAFIAFMGFLGSGGIHPRTWNTLFWISALFGTLQICYRSFSSSDGEFYYYYTITSPESYLIAKMIYNATIAFVIMFSSFFAFSLFLGNPVQNLGLYTLAIFLGVCSLALVFTLITAIADKSSQKNIMTPILGFPTSLPVLSVSVKLAKNAMDGIAFSESIDEITILAGLFLVIFALSVLLYPFIWRS